MRLSDGFPVGTKKAYSVGPMVTFLATAKKSEPEAPQRRGERRGTAAAAFPKKKKSDGCCGSF